jgi:hypothetical protein
MRNIEVKLTVSEELVLDTHERVLATILGAEAAKQAKALVAKEGEHA